MDYTEAAAGFGLLADPSRLCILVRLGQKGEQSATELLEALSITQPTLSHHMKFLCQGGLVEKRRQGQRVLYRLERAALERLLAVPLAQPAEGQRAASPVIVRSGHKW